MSTIGNASFFQASESLKGLGVESIDNTLKVCRYLTEQNGTQVDSVPIKGASIDARQLVQE